MPQEVKGYRATGFLSDLVPRIIPASQWARLEGSGAARSGTEPVSKRRLRAYGDILRAGIIPANRVLGNAQFRKEMLELNVPSGVHSLDRRH